MKLHIGISYFMPGVLFHGITRDELEIDDWVLSLYVIDSPLTYDWSEIFLLISVAWGSFLTSFLFELEYRFRAGLI